MDYANQLPDYFKRIHYKTDDEMVDGYKIMEIFTQNTDYDIRKLHTVFRTVLTVNVTIMILIEEVKVRFV